MPFRRSAAAALVALALVAGCKDVTQQPAPSEIVVAAFNSSVVPGGPVAIPTPNDLALQAMPTLPASAQKALLQAFIAAGGFPSDQAVGITIPIKRAVFDAATQRYDLSPVPPNVDRATLTTSGASANVVVLKIDGPSPVAVGIEVDAANCTTGQIALQRAAAPGTGSRAWAPGRYVFALRGGAAGVKTTTGLPIGPDQAIALVAPNLDLTNPNNQPPGGLPPALAAQVDQVRQLLWNPVDWNSFGGNWIPNAPGVIGAFPAVAGAGIPASQVSIIGTFEVAPAAPVAPVDAASGIAPLPLDLLRTGNSGTTIAYNAAFGPAATGLTTLDGFSTTAMIFAPVTVPVDASSVTGQSVHLFKIKNGTVTRLKELKEELGIFAATSGASGDPAGAAWVAEPTPITTTQGNQLLPGVPCAATGGCSLVVGLQPAANTGPTPLGTFYLPPLEEATDYAVVITTSVKDMLGRPMQKSTIARMLIDAGFDPLASSSVNGTSYVTGVSNDQATALQKMRQQLVPVLSTFSSLTGRSAADVALAYTFHTQGGITSTALGLVQVPYGPPIGVSTDPDAVTTFTPDQIAAGYGIDPTVLTTLGTIAEFAEVKVQTVNWLLGAQNTGAFDPTRPVIETHTALVVVPNPALVTAPCPAASPAYTAGACAPLVVFEHGLGSSKAEVLPLAGALAARGFVVAAIDLPMHGERSYCSGSTQAAADAMCCPASLCGTASTCAFKANLRTPVDAVQIGVCESAPGVRGRMLDHRFDNASAPSPKGTAFASANQLISLNFFRVRDALRQDTIDVSALVKALAPIGASTDAFATYLLGHDVAIDFSKVYWIGHSGGVFAAAGTLGANPRISRGVAYAGGATAIDVFANPQSYFHASLVALLGAAGIAEGTPDYLKFLQIGKWILDPADPANFARYVVPAAGTPLPSPFALPPFDTTPLASLWPAQPAREFLHQLSLCDGTVPNTQNTLLSGLVGRRDDGTYVSGYTVPAPDTSTTGHVQWFSSQAGATGGATCPAGAVDHSNPWDFGNESLAVQAQSFMGGFLASPSNVTTPVLP